MSTAVLVLDGWQEVEGCDWNVGKRGWRRAADICVFIITWLYSDQLYHSANYIFNCF